MYSYPLREISCMSRLIALSCFAVRILPVNIVLPRLFLPDFIHLQPRSVHESAPYRLPDLQLPYSNVFDFLHYKTGSSGLLYSLLPYYQPLSHLHLKAKIRLRQYVVCPGNFTAFFLFLDIILCYNNFNLHMIGQSPSVPRGYK